MLNGVIGRPSLQCCLFSSSPCYLFSWIPPLSRTEHISKYRSIEKFMKLPFEGEVIHRKRSSNKGAMSVLLQRCVLSKNDFRTCCTCDLDITACRNLWLSWFLICWNHNFMVLLNIQKYSVFSPRDHAKFWWDRWLHAHWPGDVNDLDHSIF
jgi:hypothetical protein